MLSRQFFNLSDTGSMTDTGPSFNGRVEQWRWVSASGDTGGNIDVGIYPRAGDTGDGWFIITNVGLATQHRASFPENDTGVVVHGAGDRLRVAKTGAAPAGRLYFWISEGRK